MPRITGFEMCRKLANMQAKIRNILVDSSDKRVLDMMSYPLAREAEVDFIELERAFQTFVAHGD